MSHRGSTEKQLISFMERALWKISPDVRAPLKPSHNYIIYGRKPKGSGSSRKKEKDRQRHSKHRSPSLKITPRLKTQSEKLTAVRRRKNDDQSVPYKESERSFSSNGDMGLVGKKKRKNLEDWSRLWKYTDQKGDIVEILPRGAGVLNNVPCLLSEFWMKTNQKSAFALADDNFSERLRDIKPEVVVVEINDISSDEESIIYELLDEKERPTTRSVITQNIIAYRVISNQRSQSSSGENNSPPNGKFREINLSEKTRSFSTSDESETSVLESSRKQNQNLSSSSDLSRNSSYLSPGRECKHQSNQFSNSQTGSIRTEEIESYSKGSSKSKKSDLRGEVKPSKEKKESVSGSKSPSRGGSISSAALIAASGIENREDDYSEETKTKLAATRKSSTNGEIETPKLSCSAAHDKELLPVKTDQTGSAPPSVADTYQHYSEKMAKSSKNKKSNSFFGSSSEKSHKTESEATNKQSDIDGHDKKRTSSKPSNSYSSTNPTSASFSNHEVEFNIEELDPEMTDRLERIALRYSDDDSVAALVKRRVENETYLELGEEAEGYLKENPENRSTTSSSSLSSLSWRIIT